MKQETVTALIGLAIAFEETDLEVSHDLMRIALQYRPGGLGIQQKLALYKRQIYAKLSEDKKLNFLVESGMIAIIPIGFRCFTRAEIKKKLNVRLGAKLPFDVGFFSPDSVASLFCNPKIELSFDDGAVTHQVCIKTEDYIDPSLGTGVKFESSSYEEINFATKDKKMAGINKYLDTTFGYYTLDVKHGYVLAHYNWHKFADLDKSRGSTLPSDNLQNINNLMNRRIARLLDMCETATHVFFVFHNSQSYDFIQIDNKVHRLSDFSRLEDVLTNRYGSKFSIVNLDDICGYDDLLFIITDKKMLD